MIHALAWLFVGIMSVLLGSMLVILTIPNPVLWDFILYSGAICLAFVAGVAVNNTIQDRLDR